MKLDRIIGYSVMGAMVGVGVLVSVALHNADFKLRMKQPIHQVPEMPLPYPRFIGITASEEVRVDKGRKFIRFYTDGVKGFDLDIGFCPESELVSNLRRARATDSALEVIAFRQDARWQLYRCPKHYSREELGLIYRR